MDDWKVTLHSSEKFDQLSGLNIDFEEGVSTLSSKYLTVSIKASNFYSLLYHSLFLGLISPGILIHELGHVIGIYLSKLAALELNIVSMKFVYWSAPALNFLAASTFVFSGTKSMVSIIHFWFFTANIVCLAYSSHDINYKNYYEDTNKGAEEQLKRLAGEN